ncbi:MAG: TRAP transporter small permease [Spirochaetes bacterium]|nr:TRAP transporter small permease [Spirochaetota bacterium]
MPSRFENLIIVVSKFLNIIAGIALTVMMFLTVIDVALRAFGAPIIGTYEIVALLLALVIGFGIPQVSMDRGHVYMEILLNLFSKRNKAILNTTTRIICIFLFILIGYNVVSVGNEFRMSGEVSPTIKLPFFPMAYGVGVCCFIECFVFIVDILKIWRGKYE